MWLVVECFVVYEGLGIDFMFDVMLLFSEVGIMLVDMLGKLFVVLMVCFDGGLCYFIGYCIVFLLVCNDDLIVEYCVVLCLWSYFLWICVNNCLFFG